MSCNLTTGRKLSCNDSVGGIKAVYFAEYGTMGALSITAGEVTAFGGNPDFYEFDVRGGQSSLEQTITGSKDNGTVFYEQTVNVTLQKLDRLSQEEIIKIAKARPHVVVKTFNDQYLMVGAVSGADCTGGTIVTGAAMGDLSGFTLVMSGMEVLPAFFVDTTAFVAEISTTQVAP
jgi:hypothetical protein